MPRYRKRDASCNHQHEYRIAFGSMDDGGENGPAE
jgi:hypothetical protein